jgi:glycosyltransferase involved in cell wall biosynthesis
MSSPTISILTTVYNRERYLAECIESVQKGRFQDYEHIIVDDGSTDKSVQIAQSYAAEDSRIRVYQNETNLGDYPNRNRAASLAEGKYLKYVDADDLIYPWGLRVLWESMERFPNAGWGLCSLAQDLSQIFPFELSPAQAYRYHYLGPGLFHKAPLSSIIRKTIFDEVGGFEPYSHAGDFDMWHRLAKHSPVVCMSQGIVWYRVHDDQSSNTQHLHIEQYTNIERRYLTDAEAPLSQVELNHIHATKKRQCSMSLALAIVKGNFPQARSKLRQLRTLEPFIKRTL